MLNLSKRSNREARARGDGNEHRPDTEAAERNGDLPVFYFDDCCPLCRGYTATFTALGLSGRQGFSTIDDDALADLDFDRARHQIPLRDPVTGSVAYGLDGILGLVAGKFPTLDPVLRRRPVRWGLDGFYWFVTYNRRHIVTAPPPVAGVDCAPDFNRSAVLAYLGFCAATASLLGAVAGTWTVVAASTGAALLLALRRHRGWRIVPLQALGHVGSVAVASAVMSGVAVGLLAVAGASSPVATTVGLLIGGLTGARKLWLRRWMARPPHKHSRH